MWDTSLCGEGGSFFLSVDNPFYVAGFRTNHVHSWSICFFQPELVAKLAA
jgi:hypothetical protein